MLLNVFRFLFIDAGERAVRVPLSVQQLIKLRLNRLCVTMLGTLNEQSHEPNDQGRDSVPVQTVAVENKPEERIQNQYGERAGVRSYYAKSGKQPSDKFHGSPFQNTRS
jgi:hypothetical protein